MRYEIQILEYTGIILSGIGRGGNIRFTTHFSCLTNTKTHFIIFVSIRSKVVHFVFNRKITYHEEFMSIKSFWKGKEKH